MSHNDNIPQRSARNHWPAIIAILVALALAVAAFMWFGASSERGETAPADPVPAAVTEGTVPAGTISPPGTPGAATTTTTTTTAPATN